MKQLFTPAIPFFLLGCITFTACKKEKTFSLVENNNQSISTKTLTEQRDYLVTNFKVITNELAKATKDPNVRQLIEAEAAKQFDGDYNVLIKDLIKIPSIALKVDINKINSGLNAFKGIEGSNYYPQIYVPRLSRKLSNHATNSSAVTV